MSRSAYPLEAPRPRQPPPPPLTFSPSAFDFDSSISFRGTGKDTHTLLYDVPSSISMTSPTSPRSRHSRVLSPTSPTFTGRQINSGRPTPPPSARNRSTTPSAISSTDLEKFGDLCKQWYFHQDDEAGRLMSQTLTNLPPSQRAPFSRLQASVRSAFHRSINSRKTAEFHAHLNAIQPGGSLMPHSRGDPRGKMAVKERYERTERFIRNWCTMGMPGTRPFFEGLWALMRLQVLPDALGGAGPYHIEWEIDDAVFKEAAGKDFMLEAVDVLKGVMGFEEKQRPSCPSVSGEFKSVGTIAHSRLSSVEEDPAAPFTVKRTRAPSDPFLDSPALPHSVGLSGLSGSSSTSILPSRSPTIIKEEPQSLSKQTGLQIGLAEVNNDDDLDEMYLRMWTTPDLANPEWHELIKLFPAFITRRQIPRFPASSTRQPDIEEGEDAEGKQIHFGTGSMRISPKQRTSGWQGGWWIRFVIWCKRMFC